MDDSTTPLAVIRNRLALAVGENAVFDGWSEAAVDSAAIAIDIDPAVARLAFPKDQRGMIAAYADGVDIALAAAFPADEVAALRVSERVRVILLKRLELMAPAREAVRRALAILAMPQNVIDGARLGWRSADRMWRLAGDTATDFNHYSKRAILSSIYASTLLVWIDDDSEGWSETRAFLDRRLTDVGKFEKLKAEWRGSAERRPSFARFVGRLRYPPT
ncbi:MAG: COQ9 family protein [Sphingomicrobium sp.]|nr:COQ9 family protein [Sphingomonadales bacterium]